jgi:hypothetical protein
MTLIIAVVSFEKSQRLSAETVEMVCERIRECVVLVIRQLRANCVNLWMRCAPGGAIGEKVDGRYGSVVVDWVESADNRSRKDEANLTASLGVRSDLGKHERTLDAAPESQPHDASNIWLGLFADDRMARTR